LVFQPPASRSDGEPLVGSLVDPDCQRDAVFRSTPLRHPRRLAALEAGSKVDGLFTFLRHGVACSIRFIAP
jgi:hypothetical protein